MSGPTISSDGNHFSQFQLANCWRRAIFFEFADGCARNGVYEDKGVGELPLRERFSQEGAERIPMSCGRQSGESLKSESGNHLRKELRVLNETGPDRRSGIHESDVLKK